METSNAYFNCGDTTGQGSSLQQYRIDVSGLSKPTNIRSDRELEIEISKICDILKDTCKQTFFDMKFIYLESHDWKKRTEGLKRVQEISLIFDDVVEGNISINGQYYLG